MTPGHVALVVQFATALFMTGVIWYAQVVHYPLFARVPASSFPPYQKQNVARTAAVVIPPMFAELVAGLALLGWRPGPVPRWSTVAGAVLLALIWILTAAVQAPAHGRIALRFDARTHRLIVGTNWIRTLAWTARAALSTYMLLAAFVPA